MVHKGKQEKHSHETEIAVIMASVVMLVAAPLFVYASEGTGPDFTQTLSQISKSVVDLQAQITGLGSKVDGMSTKLDSLSSRVESMALADKDADVAAPGVSECLANCRKTTATCLSARLATPTSGAVPTAGITASRSACLAQSNTCINSCKPKTTGVSCDTGCAVQLGACIRGAGSSISDVKACRSADENCLLGCTPQALNLGNLRATVSVTLPPGTCQSQCSLDHAICRQGARFDQVALDECQQVQKTCAQVACTGATRDSAPAASAPAGQAVPTNIACENICTDTYFRCRQNAGSSRQALDACGETYGTCRNQCLIQSGGGFGTMN